MRIQRFLIDFDFLFHAIAESTISLSYDDYSLRSVDVLDFDEVQLHINDKEMHDSE